LLKIPPTQEKRRRASVGAVVKKTGFGKVNVGSILANMMVKFPLLVVNSISRLIRGKLIHLAVYSMPSYTKSTFGNFPGFQMGPFYEYGAKGDIFIFFHAFRYGMKSK
jgi:hypothetical protein